MNKKQVREMLDEYVSLDVQIKALEKRMKVVRENVISLGEGAHAGLTGSVSVTVQSRNTLTPAKVKELLTPEQFQSCYSESKAIVCRVTPFNIEEKEAA